MKKTIQRAIYYVSAMFFCLAGSSITVLAQSNDSISMEAFIQQAATIGSNEVAMGNLGVKRAQNEKVKTYAEQIVADHIVINADLSTLARAKVIKLPDSMSIPINSMQTRIDTALDDPEVKLVDAALKKDKTSTNTTAADFDSQYVKTVVNDHQKAIALYNSGSKQKDPDVQTFCLKYLPVLKRHLEEATRLSTELSTKK